MINYKSKCHMVTKFLCSPVSNGFVYGIKSKTIQMTFAHFARRQLYKSEVRKSTDEQLSINQKVTSVVVFLSFWASIIKPLVWPGASGDPAAKSNQRLKETFDHLHAQLNHRKHKSYRGPGKTYSTVPKTRGVKSRGQKSAQKCNGGNLSNSGKASASC